MELNAVPRKILSLAAVFITGFLLAIWCMPILEQKPRPLSQKPGFSLVIPLAQIENIGETIQLNGKLVRVVRHGADEKETCIVDHPPLRLSVQDKLVLLAAGFESLESLILTLSIGDLKVAKFIDVKATTALASCRIHPKVTYGE